MMAGHMLLARIVYALSIALVAVSMTFGISPVRAQSDATASSWQEIIDPLMTAIHTMEARLASIEAAVASFAGSFTTQQLTTGQLCVSDEAGARTCISKAQLDALLGQAVHAAALEAPAAAIEAPAIVAESSVSAISAPAIIATVTVVTAPAIEPPAGVSNEMPSAALGPAEDDTTIVIALEPVAVPAEREDNAVDDEQPAHTGSVITARSGDAIVFHPEVHVAIPAPVLSSE